MVGVIALVLSNFMAGQLGGCELYQEVVTHLDSKGLWACVQQHNALGTEDALRRPMRVSLKDGRRTEGCPRSKAAMPVWPKAKARGRIEGPIDVDASEGTVTLGETSHRFDGPAARRLRALTDILATCKRCEASGWNLGKVQVIAIPVPVKDDCDGLVSRVELFAVPGTK